MLVIAGTAHHTFTDVVPYFGAKLAWVTKLVSTHYPPLSCFACVANPIILTFDRSEPVGRISLAFTTRIFEECYCVPFCPRLSGMKSG